MLEKVKSDKLEILNLGNDFTLDSSYGKLGNEISNIKVLKRVNFKYLKVLNFSLNQIDNINVLEKVNFKELRDLNFDYKTINA